MNGIIGQNSIEATLDFGINIPKLNRKNINQKISNSPYKYGYNKSFEISYQWERIGLGVQTFYSNINNQEYTLSTDFQIAKATNFRGAKSRIIAIYLPFYIHVYKSEKLKISPLIGLGMGWFRQRTFTWKVEQFGSVYESVQKRETSSLIGGFVGLDITHVVNKYISIKYGIQSSSMTELLGKSINLVDFSAGVSYSFLN